MPYSTLILKRWFFWMYNSVLDVWNLILYFPSSTLNILVHWFLMPWLLWDSCHLSDRCSFGSTCLVFGSCSTPFSVLLKCAQVWVSFLLILLGIYYASYICGSYISSGKICQYVFRSFPFSLIFLEFQLNWSSSIYPPFLLISPLYLQVSLCYKRFHRVLELLDPVH